MTVSDMYSGRSAGNGSTEQGCKGHASVTIYSCLSRYTAEPRLGRVTSTQNMNEFCNESWAIMAKCGMYIG